MNIEEIIVEMARVIEARDVYKRETKRLNALVTERDNRIDDLLLDQNNLKDENIHLKEQIIKLENALDHANGDYIVEEEN